MATVAQNGQKHLNTNSGLCSVKIDLICNINATFLQHVDAFKGGKWWKDATKSQTPVTVNHQMSPSVFKETRPALNREWRGRAIQRGFALYIKMLMRNFQLPEAAFTYQRPGTCPRARHCRRQMGYTAGKDCTEGTAPSRGWAPSFAPLSLS